MQVWLGDRLVEQTDARISLFDHGLTVGDGVFETVKVQDGAPFALRRHLDRLANSATGLGLAKPDFDAVAGACASVIRQTGMGRFRLRITYTAGVAPLGSGRGEADPTLIVAIAPVEAWPPATTVAVVPWHRNERSAVAGLKTTSYAENVVALAYAQQFGAGEAIFADTSGRLSEGTGSNVFVVTKGQAMTPMLSSGCLAGVTRALVLEWTDAVEAELPLAVLDSAEEVFLTSTTRDVQAVSAVVLPDGMREFAAVPGPVTAEIAAEFSTRSAADPEP